VELDEDSDEDEEKRRAKSGKRKRVSIFGLGRAGLVPAIRRGIFDFGFWNSDLGFSGRKGRPTFRR
jgi:hypothetical protein